MFVRIAVMSVTALASASILWARQTPDALLRASSFVGAMGQVAVFLAPTAIVYLLVLRSSVGALAWGLIIAASNSAMWWSVARDRHSTASIGPALLGWALLPVLIGLTAAMARLWRTRDTTFGLTIKR